MTLGIIFARARNGVIGDQGQLPWHLPEDLAHFKASTQGCPVIMGRKTWDSLPPRFRPLPGRRNIVVSRQSAWQAEGALRAGSLDDALALCEGAPRTWVIGGAELYAQAAPLANIAEVTLIDADYPGDAFAPTLGPDWTASGRSRHISATGLGYEFITYQRNPS